MTRVRVVTVLLLLLGISPGLSESFEQAPIDVVYGGVVTAAPAHQFPHYAKDPNGFSHDMVDAVKRLQMKKAFPFTLMTSDVDLEKQKKNNQYYTLAIALTRDDAAVEKYENKVATVYKVYVNVGLCVLLYKTNVETAYSPDGTSKPVMKNVLVYSFPLVGYSMNLESAMISEAQLTERFRKTAITTLENHLANKFPGMTMDSQSRKIASSPDTYQVVEVKVSSKRAEAMFGKEYLTENIATWFSGFMAQNARKSILPPTAGNGSGLLTGSTINMIRFFTINELTNDTNVIEMECPKPRFPIVLDLAGIGSGLYDKNDINEIWVYRSTLKISIPDINLDKEVKHTVSKDVAVGQTIADKDVFRDAIYGLMPKSVEEIKGGL